MRGNSCECKDANKQDTIIDEEVQNKYCPIGGEFDPRLNRTRYGISKNLLNFLKIKNSLVEEL